MVVYYKDNALNSARSVLEVHDEGILREFHVNGQGLALSRMPAHAIKVSGYKYKDLLKCFKEQGFHHEVFNNISMYY